MRVVSPRRVRHSYRQALSAPPEQVFPLLCPVRETEWARGWQPSLVVSESGIAEAGCLFVTPGSPEDTVWVVTEHDPERFRLAMLMVTPKRSVGRLEIALSPAGGDRCEAEVSYSHTSLGPEGDAFLDGFTAEHYQKFMRDWETELNHYLTSGAMLAEGAP